MENLKILNIVFKFKVQQKMLSFSPDITKL